MLQKFAIVASLAAFASAWHQQAAHGGYGRSSKQQQRPRRAQYANKVLSHQPHARAHQQFDRQYAVAGAHTDRGQRQRSFQDFNKTYGARVQGVRQGYIGGRAPHAGQVGHQGYGYGAGLSGFGAPARGGFRGAQRPGRPGRPDVPALRNSSGGFSQYHRGGKPDKYRYDVGESSGKGGVAGFGDGQGDVGGSIDKDRRYDADDSYDIGDKNQYDFDALDDINKDVKVDYDESGDYGGQGGINKDRSKDYDTSKDKRNKSGNGGYGGYGFDSVNGRFGRRGRLQGRQSGRAFNDDGFGGRSELEFQAEAENGAEEIEDNSQFEYGGELETGREVEMR